MRRGFIITIAIILILVVGMYFVAYMQIQNIFDEMYYGHDAITFLRPTNASYDNFGLQDIPNSLRNMVDNEIIEYLQTDLLNDGELLSFEWLLDVKKLKFMYICPSVNGNFNYVFDIVYTPKDKTLCYFPLRISSNNDLPYDNIDLFLNSHDTTRASIEKLLSENFFDKIVMRWLEVNGQRSHFSFNNIGEIYIENHLWDNLVISKLID